MLLSQSSIYGIRAALYLAEQHKKNDDTEKYYSTKNIGEELDISFYFLSKILYKLADHDIIKTYRGPKGGVKLSKPPDKINLIDIIEAIEGQDVLGDFLLDDPESSKYQLCELHKRWRQSKQFINENLWQVNLEELIKEI